jgi:hypothetical protein
MDNQEPLMNLKPQTCQEKLVWERHKSSELEKENKSLKLNLGILKSEIDELNHHMTTDEKGTLILKNRNQKGTIKDLENKIKDLKKENADLLQRVINLQKKEK